jgi:hypothetical protein
MVTKGGERGKGGPAAGGCMHHHALFYLRSSLHTLVAGQTFLPIGISCV